MLAGLPMVQVEILEKRERSVLVQITYPDGSLQ